MSVPKSKRGKSDLEVVTEPFFITDTDNHKQYTASIQIKGGKPVLIYDELKN